MKAVIMAGGKGTRLRPLTCDLPKPMVPIINYPVMEHIIKLLKAQGITEIAVTTFYLPRIIEEYFGSGEKWGVNLHYYVEETPLGTAGSVHNADQFLDETFMVISGDAITDYNLKKGIEFHQQRGADGTLILSQEDIPLEYGVVMTDKEGKIVRFLEKPNWGQVFSDTVNTGIYILEPEIFNLYEKGRKFDFSQDLFPLMLSKNMDLYGVALDGYWNDIGNLTEYHKTQFDFLRGKIDLPLANCTRIRENIWVEKDVEIAESAKLTGPLYIGRGTRINEGVTLGASVIGGNNLIKPHASLKRSILWRNNIIGSRAELRGTILTDKVVVRDRATIFDHTALGRKVNIGKEARIKPGVKVWPEKNIDEKTEVESSIIWSPRWDQHLFSNKGVVGESNIDITPEFMARLATAYGSTLHKNQTVTVSGDRYKISNALKKSLIAGLQTAGINVIEIDDTVTSVVRYAINKLNTAGGVHIRVSSQNPHSTVIEFLNQEGVNISASRQRSIEKKFFAEDYNRAQLEDVGVFSHFKDMNIEYIESILATLNHRAISRNYYSIVIDYEYENLFNILPEFLRRLNCQIISTRNYADNNLPLSLSKRLEVKEKVGKIIRRKTADFGLIIDHNAEELNLVNREGRCLSRAEYQVLMSYILMEKGLKNIFLPLNSPRVIEKMAAKYNAEVEYTPIRRQIVMDKNFQQLNFDPFSDAMYGLALVLEKLAVDNLTFDQLLNILPEFYLNRADVPCDWEDKGRIMRYLSERADNKTELIDGIKFNHEKGWALVIPDSEKPLFHIYAEGEDEETAESLTGFYLDKLNKFLDKDRE